MDPICIANFQASRSRPPGHRGEAQYQRAMRLVFERRYREAFALYFDAAEHEHAAAQLELGRMHLYGVGCNPDPLAGVHWLERSERHHHPVASYLLALIAVGGRALPRDFAVINSRIHSAMSADYPPALRAAALHFGRKPQDQALCIELLSQAADRGDAISAALLAERFRLGEGCAADFNAAARFRAQADELGAPRLPHIAVPLAPDIGDADTLAFQQILQLPQAKLQSEQPRVRIFDQLLSADECRYLILLGSHKLQPSMIEDHETGDAVSNGLRTSSSCRIDPAEEDFSVRLLQLRLAAAAGVRHCNSEHLSIIRYLPGEQYYPHHDYTPAGAVEHDKPQAGNRARTIFVYLNNVSAGGETDFPVANVRVTPAAGRAVTFDNLCNDGTPDPDTLHAGLPVLAGEKWLATLWLRQLSYRDY
jgi:hypothetical protein